TAQKRVELRPNDQPSAEAPIQGWEGCVAKVPVHQGFPNWTPRFQPRSEPNPTELRLARNSRHFGACSSVSVDFFKSHADLIAVGVFNYDSLKLSTNCADLAIASFTT